MPPHVADFSDSSNSLRHILEDMQEFALKQYGNDPMRKSKDSTTRSSSFVDDTVTLERKDPKIQPVQTLSLSSQLYISPKPSAQCIANSSSHTTTTLSQPSITHSTSSATSSTTCQNSPSTHRLHPGWNSGWPSRTPKCFRGRTFTLDTGDLGTSTSEPNECSKTIWSWNASTMSIWVANTYYILKGFLKACRHQ